MCWSSYVKLFSNMTLFPKQFNWSEKKEMMGYLISDLNSTACKPYLYESDLVVYMCTKAPLPLLSCL